MKRSIKWRVELLLLAIIVILAGFILFPRYRKTVSFDYQLVPNNEIVSLAQEQKTQQNPAKPQEIAVFFGSGGGIREKLKETAQNDVEEESPPMEANWLKPVGFVGEEKGSRQYLFKDSKTGEILSLAIGVENEGWILLETTSEQFLLELDGKKYFIRQNK